MSTESAIDPWLLEHLVCPVDLGALRHESDALTCVAGHAYPVVDGVPVMLREDAPPTMIGSDTSLAQAKTPPGDPRAPELYLDTLGISEDEKRGVAELARRGGPVDPVVAYLVAATNGLMYRHLVGALQRYPIPELPLPEGRGGLLLDVGCSWGRWSLAAQAKGYAAVGIDPSLGAVMAARRVARDLGVPSRYVVADARYLPFAAGLFDVIYSYSVVQHLSKADAGRAVCEMGRVVREGGTVKVQWPTRFGVRCLYHQARRGFRRGAGFDVRYWTRGELRRLFIAHVGECRIDADCYLAIGLQPSDAPLMTPALRRIVRVSERLKAASRRWPSLVGVADSVFVEAVASRAPGERARP